MAFMMIHSNNRKVSADDTILLLLIDFSEYNKDYVFNTVGRR